MEAQDQEKRTHCSKHNLKKYKDDLDYDFTDKIYLYVKDFNEAKYQHLIKKLEKLGIDLYKDPKVAIEYSNYMQDAYKITNE